MELSISKKSLQESVNKSIDDTIDAIDTKFKQNSVDLDLETIENLAAKYPSFITINKF